MTDTYDPQEKFSAQPGIVGITYLPPKLLKALADKVGPKKETQNAQ